MFDTILFSIFPYMAVVLAIVVGVYRFKSDRFSISSLSSQLLENRTLFRGSAAWHYAILIILLAHVLALVAPGLWQQLITPPSVLYVLEVIGLVLGITAVAGLLLLLSRRLTNARILAVTSTMDWVLIAALVIQVATGFFIALFYRWGADWYLHTAVPWLISLATFSPETRHINALPWIIQFHMVGGFVIVLLLPFTRLVHLLVVPLSYLWRPYQVVVWNRRHIAGRQ